MLADWRNDLPPAPENILERYRVDETTEADEPKCIISLGELSNTFTQGNISTIIGHAKSRKSYFVAYLVIEYLMQSDGCVLWVDTEQSLYYVKRAYMRIFNKVGLPSNKLDIVALRPLKTSERASYTELLIKTGKYKLVVIDGLRDLIKSINDEEVATNTSDMLLQLSADYDCHIMNVLHMNKRKEDRNPRGHIGTEMMNKSETVISVTKDEKTGEFSVVEAEQIRGRDFTPFELHVDDNDCPVRGNDFVGKNVKYEDVDDLSDEYHQTLLSNVWQGSDLEMKPSELRNAIYLASVGITRKDTQKVIDKWVGFGWLVMVGKSERDPHKRYRLLKST